MLFPIIDSQKRKRHFLGRSWPGFSNWFLCSQASIQFTIELHSLVYHFLHIREQKQLKAKGEAMYNMSAAPGAQQCHVYVLVAQR